MHSQTATFFANLLLVVEGDIGKLLAPSTVDRVGETLNVRSDRNATTRKNVASRTYRVVRIQLRAIRENLIRELIKIFDFPCVTNSNRLAVECAAFLQFVPGNHGTVSLFERVSRDMIVIYCVLRRSSFSAAPTSP